MSKLPTEQSDEKIFQAIDEAWRSIADIRDRLGGGQALVIAMGLERLWKAQRIERAPVRMIIESGRKGGGGDLGILRFRRKSSAANARDPGAQ